MKRKTTTLTKIHKYEKRETDNDQVQQNAGKSQRGVRPGRSDIRGRNNEQEGLERETEV